MRSAGHRLVLFSTAVLIFVVVLACAWASCRICEESYGPGPPYYGLTTNMDKWKDPTQQLIRINAIGLALVAAVAWGLWRLGRKKD
ncbi:hypothetical protein ACFL5O_07825 [Myxococcota bacterium]